MATTTTAPSVDADFAHPALATGSVPALTPQFGAGSDMEPGGDGQVTSEFIFETASGDSSFPIDDTNNVKHIQTATPNVITNVELRTTVTEMSNFRRNESVNSLPAQAERNADPSVVAFPSGSSGSSSGFGFKSSRSSSSPSTSTRRLADEVDVHTVKNENNQCHQTQGGHGKQSTVRLQRHPNSTPALSLFLKDDEKVYKHATAAGLANG
eukprot:Awhi_evm1s9057